MYQLCQKKKFIMYLCQHASAIRIISYPFLLQCLYLLYISFSHIAKFIYFLGFTTKYTYLVIDEYIYLTLLNIFFGLLLTICRIMYFSTSIYVLYLKVLTHEKKLFFSHYIYISLTQYIILLSTWEP